MKNPNVNVVPRQTVEEIVLKRDKAIHLFEQSVTKLEEVYSNTSLALDAISGISKGDDFNYTRRSTDEAYGRLFQGRFDAEEALKTAREIIDYDIWLFLMEYTNIYSLMDKQAKDEMLATLKENVPEVTADNVYATLEGLVEDAYNIFLRGIANVFSNLDRRFRSHNVWKLGSRIIITRAFNDWGHWHSYDDHQATLIDVERVFSQLDTGKATNTLVASIDAARKAAKSSGGIAYGEGYQTYVESDYFKIRIFKNGNCHIWFKRDDLVTKVNKLIGEYYGDVIPDDTDSEFEEEVFRDVKTSLAKNYGFFPTPKPLVDKIFNDIYIPDGQVRTCLEPSAGTGNLSKRAVELGLVTDVVEIQHDLIRDLQQSGLYDTVYGMDFHKFDTSKRYDYIIMNPPFDRGRDIDHVMRAWKFLKEGGKLYSIMHAGTEFSQTKKAKAFRKFAKENSSRTWSGSRCFEDLPKNSFSSVGTNVNTILCTLIK